MSKHVLRVLGAALLTLALAAVALAQTTTTTTTQKTAVQNPDGTYTIIEYPVKKEVTVSLNPINITGAKGVATILRDDDGTRIKLNLTDVPADLSAMTLYAVDDKGVITALGPVAISNGTGTLATTTPAAAPTGTIPNVPGLSSFITPNADFYRIDTRLTLPVIDRDTWTLTIDGDVDQEVSLGFDDLLEMPLIERDITLTCVSNEVGGPYVGGTRWTGVRLTDLLDRAGIGSTGADQILSTDVDGMTISTPLDLATDGRDAMIAIAMDGRPLPRDHGYPARMVVPGLYGYVSACKWITRMTLTTYDEKTAYWTDRGWAIEAPIKLMSRIDTPKPLANVKAGKTFIGGVAWHQHRGLTGVQVRIDGGEWQDATLGADVGNDYWRQWYVDWDAGSAGAGQHTLAVRALDENGEPQSAARATVFPDGASGVQSIVVNVA